MLDHHRNLAKIEPMNEWMDEILMSQLTRRRMNSSDRKSFGVVDDDEDAMAKRFRRR